MDVSVLILTLNEEVNLPRCLAALTWCDDVVVLDSVSDDGTQQIAESAGCRFIQREFDNYAAQRNFGLCEIKYQHSWVLMLDADEVVTPELIDEIDSTLADADTEICLYRVRHRNFLFGRWIKRSGGYPTWSGRLIRIGKVRIERAINEEYHADGRVGYLESHICHYSFNKGFHHWFEKINRYSSMEAEIKHSLVAQHLRWTNIWNSDPVVRRRSLKQLAYLMPGRPFLIFVGLYFIKGGLLEGVPGLTYCLLRAIYEFMIDCKTEELKRREHESSI